MTKDIRGFHNEYYFLSNFYASPIIHDSILFPTVEHCFQAEKTLNQDIRRTISLCKTPSEAKYMGRSVNLRDDWEDIKYGRMKLFVNKKFKIPALKKYLLATGDALLVEENTWNDRIWGTVNGKGKNLLGKILMEVRSDLQKKALERSQQK